VWIDAVGAWPAYATVLAAPITRAAITGSRRMMASTSLKSTASLFSVAVSCATMGDSGGSSARESMSWAIRRERARMALRISAPGAGGLRRRAHREV